MSISKVKTSRNLINSTLATKMSESNERIEIYNSDSQLISIDDIPSHAFRYSGVIPFIGNALSELCTKNPIDENGRFVIKNQDNEQSHYSAIIRWAELLKMATGNDPLSYETFLKEFLKVFRTPLTLYVSLGNGYSAVTHPIIIRNIVYADSSLMTRLEAERCARLGIQRKILYVDIEFLKPLFKACLEKTGHGGFIFLESAFYAKLRRTIYEITQDEKMREIFMRFYNPQTGDYIKKRPCTYYKYILYILSCLPSNKKVVTIDIDAVDMLRHVDPAQLYRVNGVTYIKNKYDTKLFMDKAGMLYNVMAKKGYCENLSGAISSCIYTKDKYTVGLRREGSKINIDSYTSNFMNEELGKNTPKTIDFDINKTFQI